MDTSLFVWLLAFVALAAIGFVTVLTFALMFARWLISKICKLIEWAYRSSVDNWEG